MKVYLDNCCFNRPFDDQSSLIVSLETEAKLHVQDMVRKGKLQLLWSFVLDYENAAHPFDEVRNRIAEWKKLAFADCNLSKDVSEKALELMQLGLRQMDASHVACAIAVKLFVVTSSRSFRLRLPFRSPSVAGSLHSQRSLSTPCPPPASQAKCLAENPTGLLDNSKFNGYIVMGADYFLTVDKKILNKPIAGIEVINPIDFVRRYADG